MSADKYLRKAMKMRYCVTGASGFVGANLVARLKAQGHYVRGVDVKDTPHRRELYSQADEFGLGDLRIPGVADRACEDMDRVYHLAADHGGMGYLTGAIDFKVALNNLAIDRNVLHAAITHRLERAFFASSACGYPVDIQDAAAARPLREADWGRGPAQGLYGEAKRMSTLMFDGARETGRLDARCAIFHQLYGPTQDWEDPRAKFPPAICRKMLEDPERVEIWGDGTQVRTFIYITDALDRIQIVMSKPYDGPVNLGSDETVTVQQCAEWVADSAGASPEWVHVDRPTGVMHRACDNAVWNARYGRMPFVSVRDGFERTYWWLRSVLADRSAPEPVGPRGS